MLIVTHLFTVFQEGTALLNCHINITGEIYYSDGVAGEAGFHTTRSVKLAVLGKIVLKTILKIGNRIVFKTILKIVFRNSFENYFENRK